jgi:hypothetical protein
MGGAISPGLSAVTSPADEKALHIQQWALLKRKPLEDSQLEIELRNAFTGLLLGEKSK